MQKILLAVLSTVIKAGEYYISTDPAIGSNELLQNILNPDVVDDILRHGCWCQRLDPSNDYDMEGVKTSLDDLDTICRKWFNLRKAIAANDNVFTVSFENEKLNCVNSEDEEVNKVCDLDVRMGNAVLKFFNDHADWEKKDGSYESCKDESFVVMNEIFNTL